MGLPESHAQLLVGPRPHFYFMGLPESHAQLCLDDNVCCTWGSLGRVMLVLCSYYARVSDLFALLIPGLNSSMSVAAWFLARAPRWALLQSPDRVPRSFHIAHRH